MTKTLTVADTLRRAKRKDADDIAELLANELSEIKQGCEQVAEALESIGIDQLETLAEALDQLPAVAQYADAIDESRIGLAFLLAEVGTAENFDEFVEAYDAAESALFDFIDLRDAESYAGIGEERASAWEEAVAALDVLADAWDQVGDDAEERI